jgi:hypothetical protein
MGKFIIGDWYKTSDGFNVEFIRSIKDDGMYNVFRHTKEHGYDPYYTDADGKTAYGEQIIQEASRDN